MHEKSTDNSFWNVSHFLLMVRVSLDQFWFGAVKYHHRSYESHFQHKNHSSFKQKFIVTPSKLVHNVKIPDLDNYYAHLKSKAIRWSIYCITEIQKWISDRDGVCWGHHLIETEVFVLCSWWNIESNLFV